MSRTVDWRPVPPVRGFWRVFDCFFGPGMTRREWFVLVGGMLVAYAGLVVFWARNDAGHWFPRLHSPGR